MKFDVQVAAKHIDALVKDPIVQEILYERKLLYFEQWLASKDPTERERIFAEARAFDSLEVALQAVVNAGLQEQTQPELERRSE